MMQIKKDEIKDIEPIFNLTIQTAIFQAFPDNKKQFNQFNLLNISQHKTFSIIITAKPKDIIPKLRERITESSPKNGHMLYLTVKSIPDAQKKRNLLCTHQNNLRNLPATKYTIASFSKDFADSIQYSVLNSNKHKNSHLIPHTHT